MKDFWKQLKPSERIMISIAGIILSILLLYLLLLEPLMNKSVDLAEKVAKQKTEIEWLKKTAVEVKQLQGSFGQKINRKDPGQSLLVVVDQTAKQNQLGDSLKRVEPDGTDRVRVWMENASFDDVTKWLGILHSSYKMDVESAVIDKVDASGLVNVRLVFVEGDA